MGLEALLRILDLLVPEHGMEPLDVLLSNDDVASHLKVGTALLPCEHICLALHEGVLDP